MNNLVVGMARSGIASAKLLKKIGDDVTIQDIKSRADVTGAEQLEALGISLALGKTTEEVINDSETKFDRIVVSPGVPTDLPFFDIARKKNIIVIGEIELAYMHTPCKLAAITGTNGKTTTTILTGEIFKASNKDTHVLGNIGTPFTEVALDLKETSSVVAEISSFQLETVQEFRPNVAAILNISPDHLNRHKTMEQYIEAKQRIYLNQTQQDYCIFNYDNEACRKMAEKCKSQVLFFSLKNQVEGAFLDNGIMHIKSKGEIIELVAVNQTHIKGAHNIENALAASAIAFFSGIDVETIREVLKSYDMTNENRIEFVLNKNGIDFYNDTKATNVDAAIRAIQAMNGNVILIAGGSDKGYEFDDLIASFNDKVKFLVCVGETRNKIANAAERANFKNYKQTNDFAEAVRIACDNAKKGDCILLSPACASFDMFNNYEQRGEMFKRLVQSFSNNN